MPEPCFGRRRFGMMAAGVLMAPRITRREHVILPETRWETPYHHIDSGVEGPTILITAGMHGNETAPPLAADELIARAPRRGRVVIMPRVNRPALARKTRHTPRASYADLNRNFPTGKRDAARGEMAPALWQLTKHVAPDWVLDLHEGWGFSASSASMGSSIVHVADKRTAAETRPQAEHLIATINTTIGKPHKRFTIIGPGPAGSFARAVVERLATPAFVFETTWTQKSALRVSQQVLLVSTLLTRLGVY